MGAKHSKRPAPENIIDEPPINPLFDESSADLSLGSSDGQIFRVRRADIFAFSSGFLDPSIAAVYSATQPIPMREPARVLEVLLQFMRPQPPSALSGRNPLTGTEFTTILEAAEAAERYKVNQSLGIFRMHIRPFATTHPFQVLQYAVKNGYGDLADEAADQTLNPQHLANRPPLENRTLVAWLMWREQYTQILALLNTRPPDHHPPPPKPKPKSKSAKSKECTHPHPLTPQDVLSIIFSVGGDPTQLKGVEEKITATEVSCTECLQAREEWRKSVVGGLEGIKKISAFVGS